MNERVEAVVEGFRNLTLLEQTNAYIEIERIWKSWKDDDSEDDPEPESPSPG
jgi:hypothetical protein